MTSKKDSFNSLMADSSFKSEEEAEEADKKKKQQLISYA